MLIKEEGFEPEKPPALFRNQKMAQLV